MDILTALAEAAPAKSNRKCKVQRWIDDIPDAHARARCERSHVTPA